MRFERLADWLSWQEGLHPNAIELGLERVQAVLQRLGWTAPACPVITIAGTKGKGSCAAMLASIYQAAGYRAGVFTSPHLRRYNERIRIAGTEITDAGLCAAFARIDAARGEISLTYFEFNTLAALLTFAAANLDAWILEVGMGGRLDAVNVVDADVALVTSIGLDHTEWLGNDLNSIAREKAGIYRHGRPALFGAEVMPKAIEDVAQAIAAPLLRAGRDFGHTRQASRWHWWMQDTQLDELPLPGIAGQVQLDNASSVLALVQCLQTRLPVARVAIDSGLTEVRLPGRFQTHVDVHGTQWILDVAHNALSAQVLATHLAELPRLPTLAILGVMADKDVDGMLAALTHQVDYWLPTGLPTSRALPVVALVDRLRAAGVSAWPVADTVAQACAQAATAARGQGIERIVVCGSFLTVGPALQWLQT
jgi:dihydrofolate synthase/folylpolyglutamate synthase